MRIEPARRRGPIQGLTFYDRQTGAHLSRLKEVALWLLITFLAIVLAVIVTLGFGRRLPVLGESMEPTLVNGQSVLVDRISYRLRKVGRYDVIAFYPGGNTEAHAYIKRVVGMPGDSVEIRDGFLLINGVPDVHNADYDRIADGGIASTPVTVAEDEYFVIGDNRNSSEDSRSASIGNVKKETILGKVWYALPGEGASMGGVR